MLFVDHSEIICFLSSFFEPPCPICLISLAMKSFSTSSENTLAAKLEILLFTILGGWCSAAQ